MVKRGSWRRVRSVCRPQLRTSSGMDSCTPFSLWWWTAHPSPAFSKIADPCPRLERRRTEGLFHCLYSWFCWFLAAALSTVFRTRAVCRICGRKETVGCCWFFVASGKQSPKKPFFFLHEYKKQADTSNDPTGQLLAEMVAAQKANPDTHPIYLWPQTTVGFK